MIDDLRISCEIALRWISLYWTDDKSTLVQVTACCRQANVDPDPCRYSPAFKTSSDTRRLIPHPTHPILGTYLFSQQYT